MSASQPINVSATVDLAVLLKNQKNAFRHEGFVAAETRIGRLNRAIDLLFDNRDELVAALSKDFGSRSTHQSMMSDIYACIEAMKFNRKNLKKWMKREKRSVGIPFNLFGARAGIEYRPKGVVGILGTWNFPVNTIFLPLTGVLAAGNRAMIKCSEVTPATAELLAKLMPKYFDEAEICCVTGGPEVGAEFSSLAFDHIIFTGAGSIGKLVMRAAAENLTPVTLELGGKSPVVIGRDIDLEDSAYRIMAGKSLNSGQVCLSPDYLFVPEESLQEFMQHIVKVTIDMFPTIVDNPDFTSVVNKRHHQRLLSYIDEARQQGLDVIEVNPGNEDFSQQEGSYKIPFTFVMNPGDDLQVMQNEIFGPVIAVKTYKQIQEVIDYINDHDRPLGLYIFSNDEELQRQIFNNTVSGGVTINDVLFHGSSEDLPFGGIGPSGMGCYHGIEGFKTFSHARSVWKQSKINVQKMGGMIPPYGEKADKTLLNLMKK